MIPAHIRPVLLVAGLALALTYPYLLVGLPPGDDRSPHLSYLHYFDQQVAQGDWYPRWINGINFGTGGPVFYLQYPLPYFSAHLIEKILPISDVSKCQEHAMGAFVVLCSMLACTFAYLWCRALAGRVGGLIGAAVYMTCPYAFSIDLYKRVAIGEYAALAWLPMALYFAEKMENRPLRGVAGMATALALLALSHPFSLVLCSPVIVCYAFWTARRSPPLVAAARALLALLLGLGMASVYLIPFLNHSHYFSVANLVAVKGGTFSYASRLFSYGPGLFPSGRRSWLVLDAASILLGGGVLVWVGLDVARGRGPVLRRGLGLLAAVVVGATLVTPLVPGFRIVPPRMPLPDWVAEEDRGLFVDSFFTFCVAILCYWSSRWSDVVPAEGAASPGGARSRRTVDLLAVVALASYVMMTTLSYPVWTELKFLWGMLFPWRFNVLLAAAAAGLVAFSVRDLPRLSFGAKASALGIWVLVLGMSAHGWKVPRCFVDFSEKPALAFERERNLLPGYAAIASLPPADEYRRAGLYGALVEIVRGEGRVSGSIVHPQLIEVDAECNGPCLVRLGQVGYPTWKARTATGEGVPIATEPETGLMELELPGGKTSVQVAMAGGSDEKWGVRVSAVSLLVAGALFLWRGRRSEGGARQAQADVA